MWKSEMPRILRYLINDLDQSAYTYTIDRLQETILVSAQLVQRELTFIQTYSVDVDELELSPDPTEGTRDEPFINLVILKAACLIDHWVFRTQARTAGMMVKDGQSSIDTRDNLKGFETILKEGPCKAYQTAKLEFQFNDNGAGRMVTGAVSSPNIWTSWGDSLGYTDRSNY